MTFEQLNISDGEIDKFDVGSGGKEIAKKSGKLKSQNLSKLKNLKGEKLSKSQKSAKLRKKVSKSGNSLNFGAIKARPKFLTSDTRITFNCLWPAFIKASIL